MKSAKRGSKRDQTHRRMRHGWADAHKHLSQCRLRHHYECGQTREKVTCEVYCLHTPSIAAGLPSAVNDLTTTNLKNLVKVSL